jgi:selenide,water dikinase
VLGQLNFFVNENVLVGTKNADDAGVYRLSDELAAVLTVDFFTPIVDDPYSFGAIAAANSLSDVYAMGGRPMAALNVSMSPSNPEFLPVLGEIMKGAIDKMTEAGVPIIGGHTIKDKEPKFGFAVMGVIHPDRILHNAKGREGDALILTKPIGTGIVSTGVKAGMCSDEVIKEFTETMTTLNKRASEIMLDAGVSTATDITGFGLIGHLYEVLSASRLRARLYSGSVPYFKEAVRLAERDVAPGGTLANLKTYAPYVEYAKDVPDHEVVLMNDAQTSGGLLIFVPGQKKDSLADALKKEGITASHIGDVIEDRVEDGVRIIVKR